MSLLLVIPTLRKLGLCIDLATWFPWKSSPLGGFSLDSCGIFFVSTPGKYMLEKGLSEFHSDSDAGILHTGDSAAVAVTEVEDPLSGKRTHVGRNAGGFYIFRDENNSPGHPLQRYLPNGKQETPV